MVVEARWLRDLRKRCPRLVARYQKPRAAGEGERLGDLDMETFRIDKPNRLAYGRHELSDAFWACDPDGRWLCLPGAVVEVDAEGRITAYGGRTFTNVMVCGVGWEGTLIRGVWSSSEGGARGREEDDEEAVETWSPS